jgi:hypothetical protein
MDYEDARQALEDADWYPGGRRSVRTLMADLAAFDQMAARHELPDEQAPAIWYSFVQEMHRQADFYERELIRYLRWERDPDEPMTWAAIAETVEANLSSRQAAHAKWKRLLDGPGRPGGYARRAAGSAGRGGWPKGRPRKSDQPTK